MVQLFFVFMIASLAGVLAVLVQAVFVMEQDGVFTSKIKCAIALKGLSLAIFVFLTFYFIFFCAMGLPF